MTTTDTTTSQPTEATVTPITPTTPVRQTLKQHGNPTGGFEFFGTEVKAPQPKGVKVKAVKVENNTVTLVGGNNRPIEGASFGVATKFWAVVPADAPRKAVPTPAERKAAADPIVITAPKGGDQTVPPIKGAVAKAITASGKSLNEISRDHGLNPSQMRRLVNDQVAKVDLTRAQAIAKALGVPVEKLFGAATAKAGAAKANGTSPAPAGPAAKGGKSKASRAAAKLAKDAEKAAQDAAAEAPQDQPEGDQPETPAETPAE